MGHPERFPANFGCDFELEYVTLTVTLKDER